MPAPNILPLPPSRKRERASRPRARYDDEEFGRAVHSSSVAAPEALAPVDEVFVPPYAVAGAKIIAEGWYGSLKEFEATVVAIRSRFPRIRVRYTKNCENGSTHFLALPSPVEAYVHGGVVRSLS